jgi:hypothetical protein
MRDTAICVLVAIVLLSPRAVAAQAAAAAARPQTVIGGTVVNPSQAAISGSVVAPTGQPLTNMVAQARNLLTGQIGGTAATTATGQFAIAGLLPGSYVVEIVDAAGQIVGTSSFISAAAGATVAATVTATSGALTAVSTVTGLAATLTTTAAESVKFAAAAAGIAGVVAPPQIPVASPSR